MRSRYTAYALGDGDHLFRTWHARTRTDDADARPPRALGRVSRCSTSWRAAPRTPTASWSSVARWVSADDGPVRRGELHERSRFTRRGGRWVYVDAE